MAVRVVIADDEWLIAAQMRGEMEKQGYEVVAVAGTGAQALDLCLQHSPGLVLMDIKMPDMDGLEATTRIMSACPTCVVIVTGNPSMNGEADRAGAMGYVVKPLTPDKISATMPAARERFARLLAGRDGSSAEDG